MNSESMKDHLIGAVPVSATEDAKAAHPAAFMVHWLSGPVPCCVKHARALINLGRMLGSHIAATAAPEGSECTNCVNDRATGA